MKKLFGELQRIGKALMLPIAVLPAAALLLRLGADDIFNILFIKKAGEAIFANLPLIFAIGVSVGIAFDGSGAAGLAGTISYFVLTQGATTINADINMGVLAGIISGYMAGKLYNKFYDFKVPDYLGFFGGKRFVPIISGACSLILALVFGYVWPVIQNGIFAFGQWLTEAGALGVGVYGVCNSLLLPFGLHHILNSLVWFVFGDFTNAAGEIINGDLFRFLAGDPTAGSFMAGFYPIFMFGMPAAALAMYRTARKDQKKLVGGVLFSAAFTFFLTGIGEPLLFSFCFAAPLLYLFHALLQGSSLAIAYILGIKHGFGFSAGLIDYVLDWGLATKPWLLIPMGIGFFIIYYFLFTFAIKKFDLHTPGREPIDDDELNNKVDEISNLDDVEKTKKYIEYLGGYDNFDRVEACITRLRLNVNDEKLVNKKGLKGLGASGVLQVKNSIQVVVGTKAERIASDINKELKKNK
ncbi:N-acetylglucosamine-specific PTS transporter subunit IIBC [Abyssisolibacter fermentans]|uniref:N-acetylglucosamine-specific PTS transporter subunit IIBC n=1 Tax=Abyssisolibacter fermentans TaxID=1766203 RepID=UPI00082EBEA0|nr:N-acetylglucosamine-specific PTS transporter subunit IIBC [Abyssisolibacter fermentans]